MFLWGKNYFYYLFILLLCCSCTEPEKAKPLMLEDSDTLQPDQTCFDFEIAFIDSSLTKSVVNAGRARTYSETALSNRLQGNNQQLNDNSNAATASIHTANTIPISQYSKLEFDGIQPHTILDSNVKVIFYDADGAQTGNLTAIQVIIDDRTKNMFAEGNVVVISENKLTTLRTEQLNWENETRMIKTKAFVKIISPTETIEGWGLESDDKLNNYKIFKVTGIKQ